MNLLIADIDPGWAIYSNDIYNNGIDCDVEICPLPVSFEFAKDNDLDSYYLIGDIKGDENKSVSQDPIFLMEVNKFTKSYIQAVIELKSKM